MYLGVFVSEIIVGIDTKRECNVVRERERERVYFWLLIALHVNTEVGV